MDFLKATYNAHTWRCQHAYDTEREYIEAAISMGIEIFGFSDHVPCPYQDGYVSNIRMTMKQSPEYVETIRRLEAEYRDQIKIYAGFEAEYVPEFYEEQMRMFRNLGCDYMIMGQHFLGSEENGPYTGTETEDESRIRRYVDLVIDWEMTRLCKEMKELDIPLEINMLGMGEGARHYPAERFWKIAGEVGNKAILGLDAHCVRHIQDMDSYRKCMELAEKYNLNLINKLEL